MKYPISLRHALIIGGIILTVLLASIFALSLRPTYNKPTVIHGMTTADEKSAQKSNAPSKSVQPQQHPATTGTSDADTQVAADGKSNPITDACKLLTIGTAKQIVGASAHVSAASDTSSLQSSDTSITSCAFTGQNGTVQLVIRKPNGHLGISENSIEFGSGKPPSAVALTYGQAAYWNPQNKTVNVLGDNNWYIVSRNTDSQTDAEAAAKLLAPGF